MYNKFFKRVIDIVLSFLGILVLIPLWLVLFLAIKLDSKGPIFFKQKRVGIHKKYFNILKFRTMRVDTPHDMPTHLFTNPDQYITKVGKFLRKTSLDELPQIFNIFVGQMSIIGPRPALWNQEDLLLERDKYGANDVKPGLTGYAQINGRDELEIEEKAKFDGEYAKNISFLFDCKCFFGTIIKVFKSEGVVEGGTGELNKEKQENEIQNKTGKKILVVCQYYYPEPFRITDICEELVKKGNEVTVITGIPNYPMGKVYEGYKDKSKREEVINGVTVKRCFTIARRSGAIFRFLNYYSFSWSSKRAVKKLNGDFDVVLVNQLSPVMMAKAGIEYKKKFGKKLVLYCLDLWPESLVSGGIKRGSFLYNHYHKVSDKIYKSADKILVTSKAFSEYFKKEFGIDGVRYLPQYAENLFSKESCKKKPNGRIDLMFAGNVGVAQSVETIIKTANLTKDLKEVCYHIVGDGSEIEKCKKLARELKINNLFFYGRKTVEEMPKFYSMADAMLLTMQKDKVLSMTIPGKLQSYMAAGKPVIASIDGEANRLITESKTGLTANAEDYEGLSKIIRRFVKDKNKDKYALNSEKYYENHFTKERFFNKLENTLNEGL